MNAIPSRHPRYLFTLCIGILASTASLSSPAGSTAPAELIQDHQPDEFEVWQPCEGLVPIAGPEESQAIDQHRGIVQVTGKTISVCVHGASLTDVLRRMAEQGAFELRVLPTVGDRVITARFENLDTRQALRRLMGDGTYVISLESGGRGEAHLEVQVLDFESAIMDVDRQTDRPEPPGDSGAPGVGVNPELQALLDTIDPNDLPSGVLEDLIRHAEPPDQELAREIRARSGEVIDALLHRLEGGFGSDSPGLRQFRSAMPRTGTGSMLLERSDQIGSE